MTFKKSLFDNIGNNHFLKGTSINIIQWNTGKNANFLVTAGYRNSNHIEKTFSKGSKARDMAISYALSISDKYRKE